MKNDKQGFYIALCVLLLVMFMIFYMFLNINKEIVRATSATYNREHSSSVAVCQPMGVKKLGVTAGAKLTDIYIFS